MIPRAALALAALLALGASAPGAASGSAYDAKASPLDELSRDLLSTNGYELREDGRIWDKISDAPVARDEMPYLLSHLAGARRLKALLGLNILLNRGEGGKTLTEAERESVREIVRNNWSVFGVGTRRDFRSYFSPQELEELDKIPPRFDKTSPSTSMKDPEPESITIAPPPPVSATPSPAAPPPASPTQQPPTPTKVEAPPAVFEVPPAVVQAPTPPIPAPPVPTPPKTTPSLPPLLEHLSLKRPTPFAAVPLSTPTIKETPPAPPAPSKPELGVLRPWTPPPATVNVSTPAVAVEVSSPAPAAVAPLPEPAPQPAAKTIGAEQYDRFVSEGPYSKESKALLQLIGQKAPDYCLPLLRRTVVGAVVQVVLDGTRTGEGLRAGLSIDPTKPEAPPVIALSPGAIYVERKKGLFGAQRLLVLPESPSVYAELGVPVPEIDALRKDAAPARTDNGPWGAAKIFGDGSRRGSYSAQEQAGELLEQLLLLGLKREGLDFSVYAARRWAKTARLLLTARLKDDAGQDAFLDPDRRIELREWLERPEEADDKTMAAWTGSRLQVMDPRRATPEAERAYNSRAQGACVRTALEDALAAAGRRRARRVAMLEMLLDADLAPKAQAMASAQTATEEESIERKRLLAAPPACPAQVPGREETLRKASLITAEAARAERALREQKAKGEDHAGKN